MSRRSLGLTDLTPSTPAVFFPWFSCVTRRTASMRAASDFICGQLVDCYADWLGRSFFGCGNSVAPVSSREHCSKSHSSCLSAPAVLSYLSSDSFSTFHTAGSTSAYPLAFPEALAFWTIVSQETLVGTYSLHRPILRECSCDFPVPIFCFL